MENTITFEGLNKDGFMDKLYLTLNLYIVNDLNYIILQMSLIAIWGLIIIMIVIYIFTKKRISKPLELITKSINNIYNQSEENNKEYFHDDEFLLILNSLESLQEKVNSRLEHNNNIVRGISHEMKTPLSQISTILFLHSKKKEPYKKIENVYVDINQIIMENSELIDIILESVNEK